MPTAMRVSWRCCRVAVPQLVAGVLPQEHPLPAHDRVGGLGLHASSPSMRTAAQTVERPTAATPRADAARRVRRRHRASPRRIASSSTSPRKRPSSSSTTAVGVCAA